MIHNFLLEYHAVLHRGLFCKKPTTFRFRFFWGETDIASRWVYRESNWMVILSNEKYQRKHSLMRSFFLSVNEHLWGMFYSLLILYSSYSFWYNFYRSSEEVNFFLALLYCSKFYSWKGCLIILMAPGDLLSILHVYIPILSLL